MGIILQPSNFDAGYFKIAKNVYNAADMAAVIAEWEQVYLYLMLSNNVPAYPAGTAQNFIADCTANFPGPPVIAKNLVIYNAFQKQDGYKMRISKGMAYILSGLIYWHYMVDKVLTDTQAGIGDTMVDTGKKASYRNAYRMAEQRWNMTLESIENIQWWLKIGDGLTGSGHGGVNDYPEYINQHKIPARYDSIF